jgi:hypothetical protein
MTHMPHMPHMPHAHTRRAAFGRGPIASGPARHRHPRAHSHPPERTPPRQAFDQGLRSQWSRLLVTLAFFVPTITLWVIHAHADAAAGGANATLVDSFDGEGR